MPLSLRHDATNDVRPHSVLRGAGLMTCGAIRPDARLIEVRAMFEIVLMRSGAERLAELHRRSDIGVTVAATAQFLPRRMNVTTVTFLMTWEASRGHPVVKTMAGVAFRQGGSRRHFVRIEVRPVRKPIESELIQRLRKIPDRRFLLRAHDLSLAVANDAQEAL